MEILKSPAEACAWCLTQAEERLLCGFVPTMGALHDGHLSLVQQAVAQSDISCVSIFVNPLQFSSASDFEHYPSTMDDDLEVLLGAGCDMVFTGTLGDFFPESGSPDNIRHLDPGPMARGLEGQYRPGHLEGVVTIVDRLFRTVGSCTAFFGEKDFQQTLVIRDLARHLVDDGLDIKIAVAPTVRDQSGLALSSRNSRLDAGGRRMASRLYGGLVATRTAWQTGIRDPAALEALLLESLNHSPLKIEYAAVRDGNSWTAETPAFDPSHPLTSPRALVAAYLDDVRLIDNMALEP